MCFDKNRQVPEARSADRRGTAQAERGNPFPRPLGVQGDWRTSRPWPALRSEATKPPPRGRGFGGGVTCRSTKKAQLMLSFFRGAGGSRTRVQTKRQKAFYTLILPLVVGGCTREDALSSSLSSESWRNLEASVPSIRFE